VLTPYEVGELLQVEGPAVGAGDALSLGLPALAVALEVGLAALYLTAHGASVREIATVAAVNPAVWGAGQLATGWLSDHTGRKPLITAGMLVQAAGLALLVAGGGSFAASLAAAALPRRRPATHWPPRPTLRPTGEATVPAFGAADVLQRGRI
jgi:MFS family permease